MTLRDRIGETVIGADHPALIDGWHTVEYAPDGTPWRWNSGDAVLPIVADGPCVLEITLSETTNYLLDLAADGADFRRSPHEATGTVASV
jgi:hypothetical protein